MEINMKKVILSALILGLSVLPASNANAGIVAASDGLTTINVTLGQITGTASVDGLTDTSSTTIYGSLNVNGTGGVTAVGPLTVASSLTVTGAGGIKVGTYAGLQDTANSNDLTNNLYYSSGWKYRNTSPGSLLEQYAGDFYFYTAPSGTADTAASLTERMEIANTGAVTIPGSAFSVGGSTLVVSGGKVGILTNAPSVPLQIGAIGVGTPSTGTLLAVGTMAGNNKAIQVIDDGNFGFGEYWKHVYSAGSIGTLGTRHNGVDTDAISWKAGNVGIGTVSPSTKLHVSSGVFTLDGAGSYFNIAVSSTITSATDPGAVGDIRRDADYIYVCTSANTWKRAALTTWP